MPWPSFRLAFVAPVESRLAGPGRARLAAEDEALRLLLQIGREAVEAAGGARELVGEDVDSRHGFGCHRVRECGDRAARFLRAAGRALRAARHALDRLEAFREVPVRIRDFGKQLVDPSKRL